MAFSLRFPMGRRIAPSVSPLLLSENFAKTVKHAKNPSMEGLNINNFGSPEGDYSVSSFWLIRRSDIGNILDISDAFRAPSRDIPNIVEIGAGRLLLSGLLAREERATITAVEPFKSAIEGSPYLHQNLNSINADAEWAVNNFGGEASEEIDLAIWSWPVVSANPFEMVKMLGTRAVLFIFSPEHGGYRRGHRFMSDDVTLYRYFLDFDKIPGYKKALVWRGLDHQDVYTGIKNHPGLEPNNIFALYLREDIPLDSLQVKKGEDKEEYPWVKEFLDISQDTRSAVEKYKAIRAITEREELCPKEVYED